MIKRTVLPKNYDRSYYLQMCGNTSYKKGIIDIRFYEAFSCAGVEEGMNILDLGTGRGEMAVLCAKNKARIFAIDYSSEAIKISEDFAQKNLGRNEKSKISFEVMNAKNLKFSDKYFDRVFFLETLEHLYPQECNKVLKEIKRVLKPDGKLILTTGPNALLIKPVLFFGSLLTGRKNWESRKYHVNEQSFFSLKDAFKKHQFEAQIKICHDKNWLWGQIRNQISNKHLKSLIFFVNQFFDSSLSMAFRKAPCLRILLGTHFICLCSNQK